MRKTLCWILALIGTGAMAVALASALSGARAPQGPPLSFEGGCLAVPISMRSGEEYDVQVEVLNAGREPARLIGILEYCGGACYSVRGLPVAIPRLGRNHVVLHIKARTPGMLDEEVTFYTDRPSQPTLTLKVQGFIEDAAHETTADAAGRRIAPG
jgi:hypothetical protein